MDSRNQKLILSQLKRIMNKVPEKDLMSHIELACSQYDNIATVPNKELATLLEEYSAILDMDDFLVDEGTFYTTEVEAHPHYGDEWDVSDLIR